MRWREQTKLLDREACVRLLNEIVVKVPEKVGILGEKEYNLGGELRITAEADLERLATAENVETSDKSDYSDINVDKKGVSKSSVLPQNDTLIVKTSAGSEIGRDRMYTSELGLKLDCELQPEKFTSTCDTVKNDSIFIVNDIERTKIVVKNAKTDEVEVTDKMFKTSDINTTSELQPEKVTSFCDTVYKDFIVTRKETDKNVVKKDKNDKGEVTVKTSKTVTVTDRYNSIIEKSSIGKCTNVKHDDPVTLEPQVTRKPLKETAADKISKTTRVY